MPYQKPYQEQINKAKETPIKYPKGQVAHYRGTMEQITEFYNNFEYKIKASNIFPEVAQGSSTGFYTIIVFYDK